MDYIPYHYGRAVRRCTYQLLDLFNRLNIYRYDPSGNINQIMEVPVRFGPKDKLYEEINTDRREHTLNSENPLQPMLSLPRMGLEFNGLIPNKEKFWASNKTLKLQFPISVSAAPLQYSEQQMPVPTKFSYTLSLACKYMDDMLQLYEQVYSMFYPTLAIQMPLDELGYLEMQWWHIHDMKFTGPFNTQTTDDNSYWITEISFNVDGWVYKYQTPSGVVPIHKVFVDIAGSGAENWPSGASGYERITVSAYPSAISGSVSAISGLTDYDYYERITVYDPFNKVR